ncbi:biopolymer transporter ExbD [bacterium]|nr:MAG: biopolymer transporter ExbD [bacterium]
MKTLAEGSRPITDINVTPLVDIILVVLIIFMATAPLIERKALRVDVPKARHSERAGLEALEVTFDKARALSIGGRALTREALTADLKERLRSDPEMRVILSADRALPYGDIVGVLDLIRGAGLRKVSLEVKGGA